MKLSDIVADDAKVPLDKIMLLRHTNDTVAKLGTAKLSVERYSSAQPSNSKYDYLRADNEISVLVIIVKDEVHGVYGVAGIAEEGPSEQILTSVEQQIHKKDSYLCRRFHLNRIASRCIGLDVTGWKGKERVTVQRSNGKFFSQIEVGRNQDYVLLDEATKSFQCQLDASNSDTGEARLARLAKAETLPTKVMVTSYYFVRNPDVVVETLFQANGICQACKIAAPFARRSDGTPYLEVHHSTPLAKGGLDEVENAIALCPNCHRKVHYA